MCGENEEKARNPRRVEGSPPRVRGKRRRARRRPLFRGITPACAGKTFFTKYSSKARQDHPRVCGENKARWEILACFLGSPPRVRGKHALAVPVRGADRITPACAGKTRRVASALPEKRDHPRVCGENYSCNFNEHYRIGSPPRVRGKHRCSKEAGTWRRITPACAGKTFKEHPLRQLLEDHPRVCGENLLSLSRTPSA